LINNQRSALGAGILLLAFAAITTVAGADSVPSRATRATPDFGAVRVTTASNTETPNMSLPDTDARFSAEGLIKDAIQLRNSQIVTSASVGMPARSSAQIFGRGAAAAEEEYSRLQEKKRLLATHELVYNGVASQVNLLSFTQNGDTATAEVSEITELTYANYEDGTTPPPTGYSYPQIVELSLRPSGWEITSMEAKTPGGIPPTTVQRTAVRTGPDTEVDSPALLDPAETLAVPNAAQKPALPSPTGVGTFTNKTLGNPGPAKDFKGAAQDLPSTVVRTAAFTPRLASSTSYNYQAMMNYAWNWAYGRNGVYPSYDSDCTNFVSQAVEAGGWSQVGGWYQYDTSWWHNWYVNASWPWAGAQNFANFAYGSGRISYLPYLSWMGAADIMQIAEEAPNNQNVTHTTIVTYVNGTDIRVSYHSRDTRDMSIWDIYYGNSANWRYYALRT